MNELSYEEKSWCYRDKDFAKNFENTIQKYKKQRIFFAKYKDILIEEASKRLIVMKTIAGYMKYNNFNIILTNTLENDKHEIVEFILKRGIRTLSHHINIATKKYEGQQLKKYLMSLLQNYRYDERYEKLDYKKLKKDKYIRLLLNGGEPIKFLEEEMNIKIIMGDKSVILNLDKNR